MIRFLRRKFMAATLSALFLLLITLVSGMIASGYYQMEITAESILRTLVTGERPAPPPGMPNGPAFGYQIGPNPMPMRYFVAEVGLDGNVTPQEQAAISGEDITALISF